MLARDELAAGEDVQVAQGITDPRVAPKVVDPMVAMAAGTTQRDISIHESGFVTW